MTQSLEKFFNNLHRPKTIAVNWLAGDRYELLQSGREFWWQSDSFKSKVYGSRDQARVSFGEWLTKHNGVYSA